MFFVMLVCLCVLPQTLYFVLSLSRSQVKVLTAAGDLRKPRRKGEALGRDKN